MKDSAKICYPLHLSIAAAMREASSRFDSASLNGKMRTAGAPIGRDEL